MCHKISKFVLFSFLDKENSCITVQQEMVNHFKELNDYVKNTILASEQNKHLLLSIFEDFFKIEDSKLESKHLKNQMERTNSFRT